MTRFMNYISNAKIVVAIGDSIPRAGQAVRLCKDLACENLATEEAVASALKQVRAFIADELECRESSMMASDQDASYIMSAKAALQAVDELAMNLTGPAGGPCGHIHYFGTGSYKCKLPAGHNGEHRQDGASWTRDYAHA